MTYVKVEELKYDKLVRDEKALKNTIKYIESYMESLKEDLSIRHLDNLEYILKLLRGEKQW